MNCPFLFRQHRLLWVVIGLYLGFIFLTLPFLPQFVDRFVDYLGWNRFGLLVNGVLVVSALAVLGLLARIPVRQWFFAAIPTLATVAMAAHIHNPTERLHVLGYLVLGVLLYLACDRPAWRRIFPLMVMVTAVGVLDEAIQGLLPMRYWDIKDVGIDGMGGALGIWLAHYLFPAAPLMREEETGGLPS